MSYLQPGTILNRNCYKITRFLAQGGFGITYLAQEIGYFKESGFGDNKYVVVRDPETVVIKELYYKDFCYRNEATGIINISDTEKRIDFQKLVNKQLEEGKILNSLKHPNIIRTKDIFKENDTAYMVVDYVDGTDLEHLLDVHGKLSKEKALHYIQQVLNAAKYIHSLKILHLDITPSNILVKKETDEAILIDFGASLTYDGSEHVKASTSKLITGMKKYFSPNEQADIDNLKHFDATFDTYAIGATLYNLLTGQKPPLSSLLSTGREKIIPPSAYNQEVNEFLDEVIIKAISPKYYDRFNDADEFDKLLKKEDQYSSVVRSIAEKVNEGRYSEALKEAEKATDFFLSTNEIENIKANCRGKNEKKTSNLVHKITLEAAEKEFNKENYEDALELYNKAAEMNVSSKEIQEKIDLCKKKIFSTEIIPVPGQVVENPEIIPEPENPESADETELLSSNDQRVYPFETGKKINIAGAVATVLVVVIIVICFVYFSTTKKESLPDKDDFLMNANDSVNKQSEVEANKKTENDPNQHPFLTSDTKPALETNGNHADSKQGETDADKKNISNQIAEKKTTDDDDDKVFTKVETEASFPGGDAAWRRYLQNNLNPNVPVDNGAPEGTYQVIVRFIVAKDGSISDIQPETNFGYGMEKEVKRVMSIGPHWKPAMQNGRNVNAYRRQPITFLIEEDKTIDKKKP